MPVKIEVHLIFSINPKIEGELSITSPIMCNNAAQKFKHRNVSFTCQINASNKELVHMMRDAWHTWDMFLFQGFDLTILIALIVRN